ncbi:hypothetical protein OJ997_35065 [Solirubrobacter phytolaccae]|uniref:Uncharacterized protein n=1 Tax=Solirubrobacter phytolaccae TaxID=1404360 RepID=A0A9X3NG30_9ACTN|nr:hypothetical protein [Solirubrobacter phytolaccae]MDA0185579.1 hypothetical protein [Solirubrobacter phytolaccae]
MHRATHWLLAAACSVPLGAYLTLADLQTPSGVDPDETAYFLIGTAAITAFVAVFGWAGVFLPPFVTVLFANVYEQYFWDRPPGLPESGMDYIAYYPSSVSWVMLAAVPYAFLVLLVRIGICRHRTRGRGT